MPYTPMNSRLKIKGQPEKVAEKDPADNLKLRGTDCCEQFPACFCLYSNLPLNIKNLSSMGFTLDT